jgi:inward rectifier potassium channel
MEPANVEKRGLFFLHRISWYHTMIDMPMAFHVYPVVVLRWNEFHFCTVCVIGIEHLNGIDATGSDLGKFTSLFF